MGIEGIAFGNPMESAKELIVQVGRLPGVRRRSSEAVFCIDDLVREDVKECEMQVEIDEELLDEACGFGRLDLRELHEVDEREQQRAFPMKKNPGESLALIRIRRNLPQRAQVEVDAR
jgi:hypothetical protein